MTIRERQDEIIETFGFFDDWMDKYEHLIDLGKELPLIDEQYKDDAHRIKGCQSQVWLHADTDGDKVIFTADSDAVITKGLISLLIQVLSGQPAHAIATAELDFIQQIGLDDHLSPTRSNGLRSMLKQMKLYAIALDKVAKNG